MGMKLTHDNHSTATTPSPRTACSASNAARRFPMAWRKLNITVEVEAKATEVAVLKLKRELERKRTARKARTKA